MATIAFDGSFEKETARPPISLHPAFPAIVALWFAALLGLGSLVLPVVLLERAVDAIGIASIVPAASPPLGFTARGILAIAAAIAGAAVGVAIAGRVARAHRPQAESRVTKFSGGSRRPISIKDEVGGEGVVNGESLPINRRRALAISEDDRPSDFLYQAPLPGDRIAPVVAEEPAGEHSDAEPLELADFAEDAAERIAGETTEAAVEDIDMTESPSFSAPPSNAHSLATEQAHSPDERIGDRASSKTPPRHEPLPFAAPSLRRPADLEPEPEAAHPVEPEVHLAAVSDNVASNDDANPADWKTAPLEALGLVQLVQRLGSTIERRRELMAQVTPGGSVAPTAPVATEIEAAPAEEAVQAMAAYFGAPLSAEPVAQEGSSNDSYDPQAATGPADSAEPGTDPAMARPGFMRSFADEEETDAEDPIPDFSLPIRRTAAANRSFEPRDGGSEDAENEADGAEDGPGSYSSLLGMGNPFNTPKGEFVRIEEPEPVPGTAEPAVVFPGKEASQHQGWPAANPPAGSTSPRPFDPPAKGTAATAAPRAPADADAALRAALATLQRMSGAV